MIPITINISASSMSASLPAAPGRETRELEVHADPEEDQRPEEHREGCLSDVLDAVDVLEVVAVRGDEGADRQVDDRQEAGAATVSHIGRPYTDCRTLCATDRSSTVPEAPPRR